MKRMKCLLILVCCTPLASLAQNVGVNATGGAPDPSAMLDVTSTNSGFLAPRMTTVQRNAIAAPANGLMVYDTNFGCYYVYSTNTTSWNSLCDLKGPYYGESTTLYNVAGTLLRTVTATTSAGDTVHIEAEFDYAKGLTTSYVALTIWRDGVEIHEIAKYSVANADNSIKATWMDLPAAGAHTYTIRYYIGAGSMGFIYGHNLVITVKK